MEHVSSNTLVVGGSQGHDTGLIDIRRHVATLWRRRWVIVASTIVAVLLALAYVAVTPAQYTAVATVLIDPRQEQVVDANSVLPNIGADSAAVTSQVNVLESRGLLEQVFSSQGLTADPEFSQPGTLSALLASVQGRTVAVSSAAAFDEFRRRVSVQRIGLTYVLEIRFTSTEPAKAATLATAIVNEYLSGLAENKSDANLSVTRELDGRIATLRASLSDAELAVERFKVEHNMLSGGSSATVMQSQIDQTTAQLSVAQEQAREAEARAAQARAALDGSNSVTGLDDLLVSEVGTQLRTQYNQRAAELLSMQATMGPRHPSLRAAEAELAGMTGMIRAEAQRTLNQLEADARLARQNVESTEAQLSTLAADANETNRASVTLRQLERDADVARSLLEEFMRRSLETSELGTMQRSEARVLSAAAEPRSATWPKANLLLALAGALGLAVGCAVALVLGNPVRVPLPVQPVEPPPPPPSSPRGRAPSFARAGMAWKKLGSIAPRPSPGSIASIAAHLDEERAGRGNFFAAVSTVSNPQLQSRLAYDLAEHFAARSVRTLILDMNLDRDELRRRIDDVTIDVISAFAGTDPQPAPAAMTRPFAIVDDRNEALALPQLNRIERWAAVSGFDIILVSLPSYDRQRWSPALAQRLDSEIVVLRTEELLADQIATFAAYRADIDCPAACVTVPVVPALVPSNDTTARFRRERVLQ